MKRKKKRRDMLGNKLVNPGAAYNMEHERDSRRVFRPVLPPTADARNEITR